MLKKGVSKWAVPGICVIILAAVMLLGIMILSLSRQLEEAELSVKPQDYLGLIVPNFSRESGGEISAFQNGGYEAFSIVKEVESRKLAAAYSPSLRPVHVWHRTGDDLSVAAQEMPNDFFVGVIVCDEIRYEEIIYDEEPKRYTGEYFHTYKYGYTCHLQEAVYISSPDAAQNRISLDLFFYHDNIPQSPMQVGRAYLVWGSLEAYEDGSAKLTMLKQSSTGQAVFVREEEYTQIRFESNYQSGIMVPYLSEIRMPLDEFWQTEEGVQWKDHILPKGEIQQHSVRLVGTSSVESVLSFHRGTSYVIEGVAPEDSTDPYACLVSEALAELNGWAVGDEIPFSVYENSNLNLFHRTYEPYVGFSEEHTYRISGIYRTEDDLYDIHAVHPNTVYVNPDSLSRDYGPHRSGSEYSDDKNFDSRAVVDERYALIIPADAVELFLAEAKVSGYPEKFFIFEDGGYSEQVEAYGEIDDDLQLAKSLQGRKARTGLVLVATLGTVCLGAMVLSGKKHIERKYAVDTPRPKLFFVLLLRQGMILAVAAIIGSSLALLCYRSFAVWWLSRVLSVSVSESLFVLLPGSPDTLHSFAVLLLFFATVAMLFAYAGLWRRYRYRYHDKEDGAC